MTERRLRLLYKTSCTRCGDSIPAGTETWWDDDRQHATCVICFDGVDACAGERTGSPADEVRPPARPDLRQRRRLDVVNAAHAAHRSAQAATTRTRVRTIEASPRNSALAAARARLRTDPRTYTTRVRTSR